MLFWKGFVWYLKSNFEYISINSSFKSDRGYLYTDDMIKKIDTSLILNTLQNLCHILLIKDLHLK